MKALFIRCRAMVLSAVLITQLHQIVGVPTVFAKDSAVGASVASKISTLPPQRSQVDEYTAGTQRIIVKFRDTNPGANPAIMNAQRMQRLAVQSGEDLEYFRSMSGEAYVVQLPERLPLEQVWAISRKLMTLPEVEYAEPDLILQPIFTPNDPQYGEQWHYYGTWGINAPAAWDLTTGSRNIVVAVIDTGITNHVDLRANTIAGYDFISDVWTANDGNGRDSNPSDPGDWIQANDCGNGSLPQNSSWHGTHVAGTIGAVSNNGLGVAGINWNSRILPVRILGRCGGSLSDLADAMRWSAGLPVPGVPTNPNPARVLNLSLGGPGSCESTLQNAVNSVTAAGAVIVAAAGNELADASNSTPANCNGVITVAATDESGDLALYSNYGSTIEISAPGGGFFSGVLSTSNAGATGPGTDNYVYNIGTSMAAPHVSGVVSLMFSRNPALSHEQVLQIIQNTARPFPGNGLCDLFFPCGVGIVDAGAAVAAVPVQSFADVPMNHWAWSFVERLHAAGITEGCVLSPLQYCPESTVTRAQMAVFLERGVHGASYSPPEVGGSTGFSDVPTTYWAGAWIKQLAAEGITGGCGSGNYCPEAPVTRAQMAVFLLRSKYGATYNPPAVGSSTGFSDVDPTYWAGAWIKQLVAEGITAGCGSGMYCPEAPVTRAQMAVFLVRTFNLP
jgi:subtilisin family serine protease